MLYNLRPLNAPTHYLFVIISILMLRLVCTSISHLFSGKTGKVGWMGVGGHALMSGCPEHWTIQPKT